MDGLDLCKRCGRLRMYRQLNNQGVCIDLRSCIQAQDKAKSAEQKQGKPEQ